MPAAKKPTKSQQRHAQRRLEVAKPYETAHAEGLAAGRVGRPLAECPYSPSTQEDLARIWIAGFNQGRRERRDEQTALPAQRRARHVVRP